VWRAVDRQDEIVRVLSFASSNRTLQNLRQMAAIYSVRRWVGLRGRRSVTVQNVLHHTVVSDLSKQS